jgi:hypothetical protein
VEDSRAPKDPFAAFSDEVKHLHATWTLWRRLFNREPQDGEPAREAVRAGDEAYRVTGAASKVLFTYVRWHMFRGVVLDLCRLCDPPSVCGQPNLSLERIFSDTSSIGPAGVRAKARTYMGRALEIVRDPKRMKVLRDKLIAHLDIDLATGKVPFPQVEIDDLDCAVRAVVGFRHLIEIARIGGPIQSLERDPSPLDEAKWHAEVDRLVELLARGLREVDGDRP